MLNRNAKKREIYYERFTYLCVWHEDGNKISIPGSFVVKNRSRLTEKM